jgi:hypothetical protein
MVRMRKFLFTALGVALCLPMSFAQRNCGTVDHLNALKNSPDGAKSHSKMEAQVNEWIRLHGNEHRAGNVLTIPVVVHVVYRNANQNISQAQIQSQIDVLNEDYRKLNADVGNVPAAWQGITADCEIQFCLAVRDPQGAPTTGITRTSTQTNSFSLNDAVKYTAQGGQNAWPASSYLNIWSCNLSGGILGYAQFPGQAAATDGVVIGYNYFGRTGTVSAPFNKGRTCTHEVGHWLGLYHIWGDDNGCGGTDNIADTPNQDAETYNCPSGVQTDACSPTAPGYMWMNYMDYTDDACMYMFTEGQKTRMRAIMNTSRAALANSLGCVPIQLFADDAGIQAITAPTGTICASSVTPVVTLYNWGSNTLTSVTINYQIDGGAVQSFNWTGSLASLATTSVTLNASTLAPGAHTISVSTSNPNGQTDGNTGNDSQNGTFTTTTPSVAQPTPFSYGFEPNTFPPTNWSIVNPDADFTWERSGAAGFNSNASAFVNNFDYSASNETDDLVLPTLNLSTLTTPTLTFDVAYVLYTETGYSDTLTVLGSDDCGATWNVLYRKSGQNLTTVTPYFQTPAFVPSGANQWRSETVSLAALAGQSSVVIKFRNTTQYENNLYIDNINIASLGSAAIDANTLDNAVSLFPNPGTGLYNVNVNLEGISSISLQVMNSQGKLVRSTSSEAYGKHSFELDLTNQPSGVYFVRVQQGDAKVTKKVIKF